jgi:5-methylcytosine-specific restriction endonuclease McrA
VKKLLISLVCLILMALLPGQSFARGGHFHYYRAHSYRSRPYHPHKSSYYRPRSYRSYRSRRAYGVKRDVHGRIVRNEEAKETFMRQTGYPHGRPGYVVDHVIPLKRGGADDPSNMQWQTIEDAKEKDKWE